MTIFQSTCGKSHFAPDDANVSTRHQPTRYCAGSFPEGVMQKFLISALAIVMFSATFLAEAVAAFPLNDWQTMDRTARH
jgi:hypothetical protein